MTKVVSPSDSNMIVRTVRVNRARTPQEALDAIGWRQYTDHLVVDEMPKGNGNEQGDETEVVFFRLNLSERNDFISDDDLEKEFELRGLKPADPISVAAVNEVDPTFADEHPHGTHWKDADDEWCLAVFGWSGNERSVDVNRNDYGWGGRVWFAGVRT